MDRRKFFRLLDLRTRHSGAAPCRFFAVQMGGDVLVGAIEPMLMTIMPGVMGSPAVAMLQEARQVMTEILEATGGKPYRPGK